MGEAFPPEGAQERFLRQGNAAVDSRQMGRTLAQGSKKERHLRRLAQQQIPVEIEFIYVPSSQGINIPILPEA